MRSDVQPGLTPRNQLMRPWESEAQIRARLRVGMRVAGHRSNGAAIFGTIAYMNRFGVEVRGEISGDGESDPGAFLTWKSLAAKRCRLERRGVRRGSVAAARRLVRALAGDT